MKRINLKDRVFNTFTILQEIEPHVEASGRKRRKYLCVCRCTTKFTATQESLVLGRVKSCGCLRTRKLKKSAMTHGLSRVYAREYQCWCAMLYRHRNNVEAPWLRFDVFIKDMGVRPEGSKLKRLDPNAPFGKDNCRWVSRRLPEADNIQRTAQSCQHNTAPSCEDPLKSQP